MRLTALLLLVWLQVRPRGVSRQRPLLRLLISSLVPSAGATSPIPVPGSPSLLLVPVCGSPPKVARQEGQRALRHGVGSRLVPDRPEPRRHATTPADRLLLQKHPQLTWTPMSAYFGRLGPRKSIQVRRLHAAPAANADRKRTLAMRPSSGDTHSA